MIRIIQHSNRKLYISKKGFVTLSGVLKLLEENNEIQVLTSFNYMDITKKIIFDAYALKLRGVVNKEDLKQLLAKGLNC